MWQWIAVAIVVVLAAIALVRSLRRDPCAGCSLKQQCKKTSPQRPDSGHCGDRCYNRRRP